MKVREILRIIREDGWYFHSQVGSHAQYKHPVKKGRVTVAGKPNDDISPKTLATIYVQAQIPRK